MANNELAEGALLSIQQLLDDGGIPRGTFVDDQVRNLVALYNRRGDRLQEVVALAKEMRDVLNKALNEPLIYTGAIEEPMRTCGIGRVKPVLMPALSVLTRADALLGE
jgi:hypothetical protein